MREHDLLDLCWGVLPLLWLSAAVARTSWPTPGAQVARPAAVADIGSGVGGAKVKRYFKITSWHSVEPDHERPRTSSVEAPFYTSWSCRAARLLEACSSSPSAFSRSCRLFTSACHSALWLLIMMSICLISSCSSGSQDDRTELGTHGEKHWS